jgi:hypothetical protein
LEIAGLGNGEVAQQVGELEEKDDSGRNAGQQEAFSLPARRVPDRYQGTETGRVQKCDIAQIDDE